LGHRIAVLRDGRLQQVGPPTEVYACPANVFVAGFLGTPAMNLLTVSVHEGRLGLPGTDLTLVGYSGAEVTVGVRPESVLLNPDGLPSVQGSVVIVEELGNESLVHATVRLEGHPEVKVVSRQPPRTGLVVGSSVRLGFRPEALRVFHPTTGDAVVAARVALPA
ncbi:MAG: TOBE domain-containing protein, partial [Actinomycetota bacterium]